MSDDIIQHGQSSGMMSEDVVNKLFSIHAASELRNMQALDQAKTTLLQAIQTSSAQQHTQFVEVLNQVALALKNEIVGTRQDLAMVRVEVADLHTDVRLMEGRLNTQEHQMKAASEAIVVMGERLEALEQRPIAQLTDAQAAQITSALTPRLETIEARLEDEQRRPFEDAEARRRLDEMDEHGTRAWREELVAVKVQQERNYQQQLRNQRLLRIVLVIGCFALLLGLIGAAMLFATFISGMPISQWGR